MPTEKKLSSLEISINGFLDESLVRALNAAESRIKSFGASVKTQNALMGQIYKNSFAQIPSAAQDAFTKAQAHANTFHEFMGQVRSTMVGMFAVDMSTKFFEAAIGGARELVNQMKEASNVAANFEQQSFELQTDIGFDPKQLKEYQNFLYRRSIEVPFRVPPSMEASRLLASVSPETDPMKKEAYLKKQLAQLEDIAAITAPTGANAEILNQHLIELADVVSKAQKGGVLLERAIYPLEHAGLLIRPFLEQKLGMLPAGVTAGNMEEKLSTEEMDRINGELSKLIKKRGVPSSLLDAYMAQLTGPGGKAFEGAAKAAKTTFGVESSTGDVVSYLQTMVGTIENGPLKDLLNAVNTGFAKQIPFLTPIFDQISAKFEKAFGSEIMPKIELFGRELAEAISKLSGQGSLDEQIDKFVYNVGRTVDSLRFLFEMFEKIGKIIPPWMRPFLPDTGQWNRPGPAPDVPKTWEQWHKGGSVIDNPAAFPQAAQAATTSLATLNNQIDKTSGNDFAHLIPAIDDTTKAFNDLNKALPGGGFSFGNFPISGPGSNSPFTVYGPGVKGDQPGGATYDPDSWNHLGHIHGVPYRLSGGDSAMKAPYAEGHYHLKPGDSYISDKDGLPHIWHDTSGAKNPSNEDIFVDKPQAGVNIHYSPTIHMVGESDHIRKILREHADELAGHVRRVFESDDARSAAV